VSILGGILDGGEVFRGGDQFKGDLDSRGREVAYFKGGGGYLKGVHSQSHGQPINRVHDLIIKNWGFVSNIKTIYYTSYTVHYPINYLYCDFLGRVYLHALVETTMTVTIVMQCI